MAKKNTKEDKKEAYIAGSGYIASLKIAVPPYLSEGEAKSIIEGEDFDFKTKLTQKQFNYLLNNAFIKKV